ncbi:site-specific integrase [Cellulosimicrobium sp. ES-005]|uniref:Site-specific integrase n=1 Tax=Cellulosimicrobium sp. ES-005 TaxID=3163031 RepID=A0AAU8G933_9MICO
MARPRMKLGEWGNVATTPQLLADDGKYRAAPAGTRKADRWRARAKVRDTDGIVRDVERYGGTKVEARRLLEEALRERVTPVTKGTITPATTFSDLAAAWEEELQGDESRSPNTKAVYSSILHRYVTGSPADPKSRGPLAGWTVRELNVAAINRALQDINKEGGPAVAKTARTVLSGILGLAVRNGAIPANPVREVDRIKQKGAPKRKGATRDTTRAFTVEERAAVLTFMDTDEHALAHDLGDLMAFLAGTGARLGEACALRWSRVSLDARKATARIDATLVRVPGEGVSIQEGTKTKRHVSDSSRRVVQLPEWLADRLRVRRDTMKHTEPDDVVFPSPGGKLRDPSNTTKTIRRMLDRAGFEWATSHTFRRTAATLMDQRGLTAREIAGQLGHASPSITTDVYMDRRPATTRAAEVL